MRRLSKSFIVVAIFLLVATNAYAATSQGSYGATSNGQSYITMDLPERAQITAFSDISMSAFDGVNPTHGRDDVCVYTNDPAGKYAVRARGDGAASAFTVTDGTDVLAYHVYFNNQASSDTGEFELLVAEDFADHKDITNGNTTSVDCSGGTALNAQIHLKMLKADLEAVEAGTYHGNVIVTVEPNP